METFDDVSRVDDSSNFQGVLEIAGEGFPIFSPGFDDRWILFTPPAFKFVQIPQSQLLI